MGTAFCTLKMTIHASVGLRSLESDENIGRYKTSPWTPWRYLVFRAEVDVRHGLIPQYMHIDLYSDKSDQVFSALQHVGWVHLPKIASVIFANFPIRLGEDFLFLSTASPASATQQKWARSSQCCRTRQRRQSRSFASSSSWISTSKRSESHPLCVRPLLLSTMCHSILQRVMRY